MRNQILTKLENIETLLKQAQGRPMSVDEAARYLNLSKAFLYKLTSENRIAFFRPNGKKIFFLKSDLDAFLLRNRSACREELQEVASRE